MLLTRGFSTRVVQRCIGAGVRHRPPNESADVSPSSSPRSGAVGQTSGEHRGRSVRRPVVYGRLSPPAPHRSRRPHPERACWRFAPSRKGRRRLCRRGSQCCAGVANSALWRVADLADFARATRIRSACKPDRTRRVRPRCRPTFSHGRLRPPRPGARVRQSGARSLPLCAPRLQAQRPGAQRVLGRGTDRSDRPVCVYSRPLSGK